MVYRHGRDFQARKVHNFYDISLSMLIAQRIAQIAERFGGLWFEYQKARSSNSLQRAYS